MEIVGKCWSVFKLAWSERMAYRVNFFLEILSGILGSLIVVFLWIAIYRGGGRETMGGYSIREMVTYLFGAGLINSFILTTAENPDTSQSIQEGSLSSLLIQPFSPYLVWFARDLGSKCFLFFIGLAGYFGVFAFMIDYLVSPASGGYLRLFLVAIIMASLLQFFLFEALSLLSFWIENTYGIRFTVRVIMEVASGAIIPLSLFPDAFQKILLVLPFPFLIYFPMRIYLGKISVHYAVPGLLAQTGWIVGLALANAAIWKKGLRRYVSMGD